jgi:hypothetical protein
MQSCAVFLAKVVVALLHSKVPGKNTSNIGSTIQSLWATVTHKHIYDKLAGRDVTRE